MLPSDVVSDLKTHTQALEYSNDMTIPSQAQAPFGGGKTGLFGGGVVVALQFPGCYLMNIHLRLNEERI